MSATEEQMALLAAAHVSHVSYVLLVYSIAFLLFLFVCLLLHLYAIHASPTLLPRTGSSGEETGALNGYADPRTREAEEFELDGLMSDDEGEVTRKTNGRII